MKRWFLWIPLGLAVVLAVVLLRAVTGGEDPAAIATPLAGKPAPPLDVALFAHENGHEGERLTGETLKGKPALVNFFASWCGPCAAENTILLDLAKSDHVTIYGIAMKDDADALKAFLDKRGNPYWRVGLDDTGQAAIGWGVSGVPETFVIDGKGNILERHVGELHEDDARHLLDVLHGAS